MYDLLSVIIIGLSVGGMYALLALGLATPAGAAIVLAVMLVAAFAVHVKKGFWAIEGGYEYNLVLAAGALTLGDFHGGAIEQCMKMFQELVTEDVADPAQLAKDKVAEMRAAKRRFPGFGHKLYKRDPRTVRMLELAEEYGFGGRFIQFAVGVQDALEESMGRAMPLNVDGAIAAILCDMGFDWKVGKGFFIIARIPGVVAHIVEEWSREKPFRRLPEGAYGYDGPSLRHLKGRSAQA